MKITGFEIWPITIPYKAPYGLSVGTATLGKHVILKMFTDEGIVGIGECAYIIPERQGETQENIVSLLKDYCGPMLIGEDPFALERIMEKLDSVTFGGYGITATKCGIDHACWDIMGKALNVPVYKLLGGKYRDTIGVSRSLPFASPAEVAKDAEMKRAMGYKMLTLKGTYDPDGDIARFIATREAMGPDYPLEVDPNQGWWSGIATKVIHKLEKYELESCEQPLPWYDLEGMAALAAAVDTPIIADEAVNTEFEALRVVNMRAADLITIKLTKCGGIFHARKIVAITEAAGLYCNQGSLHTFGPGTAAIHHFAASMARVQMPIGYGSPAERFEGDVIKEEIPFANGEAKPMEGPGLGITLDDEKMKRWSAGGPFKVGS